jgi:hypothetical protein
MAADPTRGVTTKVNLFKGDILEHVVKATKENEGWIVIKIASPVMREDGSYGYDINEYLKKIEDKLKQKENEKRAWEYFHDLTKKQRTNAKKHINLAIKSNDSFYKFYEKNFSFFDLYKFDEKNINYKYGLENVLSLINLAEFNEQPAPLTNEEVRAELVDGKIIALIRENGTKGLPDFLCLRKGEVLFLEVKADAVGGTKWHQVGVFKKIIDAGYKLEIIDVNVSLPEIHKPIKDAKFNHLDIDWEKISVIDPDLFEKKGESRFPFEDYIKNSNNSKLF